MSRPRVCVIADAVDEPYAGVSTYAKELIRRLPSVAPDIDFTFLHIHENPFFEGLEQILIPLNRSNPLDVLARKCFRIPAAIRRGRFDLVHDLFHFPPFAFQRIPCAKVVTLHDLTALLFPQWHTRTSVLMHRLFLPRVIARADCVIANSHATARDIELHYPDKACSVRIVLLASKTFVKSSEKITLSSPPLLLHVGTLEPRKNLTTLVEAFNRIRDRGHDARLALVGKRGWGFGPLLEAVETSPHKADIHLHERVDDSRLATCFKEAAVFIYPSLYEGFGLPVLEAMGQGCPVVTSNRSSLPEIAGDAALLVDPQDPELLADAIEQVLTNPTRREEMIRKGREQAGRFSWEKNARETLEIYRELLNQGTNA